MRERLTPREELKSLYTRKNHLQSEIDKINMRIRAIEISTPWEQRSPLFENERVTTTTGTAEVREPIPIKAVASTAAGGSKNNTHS